MRSIPNKRLTAKQKVFLDLINKFIEDTGKSPTIRELAKKRNDKSLRTVTQYLEALERKGAIRRQKYKSRSIEVLEEDEDSLTVLLPVLGAAGCDNMTVCAEPIYDEHIQVARSFLHGRDDKGVALVKAIGSSMLDAGVHDGDFVVTEMTSEVSQGDKVVAIIDSMAVLKKVHFAPGAVVLQPMTSDPQYKPIIMTRDFKVFGKMVDVIKYIPTDELQYEDVSEN